MFGKILITFACVIVVSSCQSFRNVATTPVPNPGPCPNAMSLYDAHRLVELKGERNIYENVGFTAEILNVSGTCRYTDQRADPINVEVSVDLAFGRGAAAAGETKVYELFLAVTALDKFVVDKQVFPIVVTFPAGKDRVYHSEYFSEVLIPRAAAETSGANYEILFGFELTDEQLKFNRSGLRFRINAGQD